MVFWKDFSQSHGEHLANVIYRDPDLLWVRSQKKRQFLGEYAYTIVLMQENRTELLRAKITHLTKSSVSYPQSN